MNFSWRYYLSTIINFILPARCLSCAQSGYFLCPDCLSLIPKANKPELSDTEAVFYYQNLAIKQAIWRLKYQGGQAIARDLARALDNYWLEKNKLNNKNSETETWLVIPIPITSRRQKERGFNQTELIAQEFVRLNSLNKNNFILLSEKILIKNRDTVSQQKMADRASRLNNLKDAFTVTQPDLVKNQNILLIDDVITTGATISEARKTLLQAGARKVHGLAVAHG